MPEATLYPSQVDQSQPVSPLVSWNRLSTRPRSKDFDEALKSKVSDPLWFLSRQWQWGEFKGENTGTAVTAKSHFVTSKITQIASHKGDIVEMDETLPLEQQIESLPVTKMNLKERIRSGQRFKVMLRQQFVTGEGITEAGVDVFNYYFAELVRLYSLYEPAEQTAIDFKNETFVKDAKIRSSKRHLDTIKAFKDRSIDGQLLVRHLKDGGAIEEGMNPMPNPSNSNWDEDHLKILQEQAALFLSWAIKTYGLDNPMNSWNSQAMEYQFACRIPQKTDAGSYYPEVIQANEFSSGRLDWDAFNVVDKDNLLADDQLIDSPVSGDEQDAHHEERYVTHPSGIFFPGMPAERWWEFEDAQVNFSKINPDTTDFVGMMLNEFQLTYANEWSMIPHTVPVGSLVEAKFIIVTDSFGKKVLIKPAVEATSDEWDKWGMFQLTRSSTGGVAESDNRIFIPPIISQKATETEPLEKVRFLRDEMANLVWGVESKIPHYWRGNLDAKEFNLSYNGYLKDLSEKINPPPVLGSTEGVNHVYKVMNSEVPDNWIPFIPVKTNDPSHREVLLQRGAMPRILANTSEEAPFPKIRGNTTIMREGLSAENEQNQEAAMYIHQEEIPRAGVEISGAWQRARWYNGKMCNWYSRKKVVGRGEGNSGLAFDQLERKK